MRGAHLVPQAHRGGRVGWADVWYRNSPGVSPYENPVTGLHFVVDLDRMELLEVEDTPRVDEAPAASVSSSNITNTALPPARCA
jgi:Cu2+-containing amine oxidase